MKRLLILFVITVLTKSSFAFFSIPDRIIIENDTFFVYSDLFKTQLRKDSVFKNISKQVDDIEKIANSEAKEFGVGQVYGIWEIIDNKIFLVKMSYKFHDIVPKEKVFANWLTDTLYASKGNVLVRGTRPVREYEIALDLVSGEVIQRRDYNNRILREPCFKISTEFIYQNIDWENIPDITDKSILVGVEIQPKINGKLDFISKEAFAIIYTKTYANTHSEITTDLENTFIKEAFRIAGLVPEWGVVIHRNKIKTLSMKITFDNRLKEKYATNTD